MFTGSGVSKVFLRFIFNHKLHKIDNFNDKTNFRYLIAGMPAHMGNLNKTEKY